MWPKFRSLLVLIPTIVLNPTIVCSGIKNQNYHFLGILATRNPRTARNEFVRQCKRSLPPTIDFGHPTHSANNAIVVTNKAQIVTETAIIIFSFIFDIVFWTIYYLILHILQFETYENKNSRDGFPRITFFSMHAHTYLFTNSLIISSEDYC